MKTHGSDANPAVPAGRFISPLVSRRDLIRAALLAGASAALGPAFSLSQTVVPELTPAQRGQDDSKLLGDQNWKPVLLNDQQNKTLIALSDVIVPATETPGAKEALVNRYLDLVLAGESPESQQKFLGSLSYIDDESQRLFGREFCSLTPEEQSDFLRPLAYPLRPSFWLNKDHPDPRGGALRPPQIHDCGGVLHL
jgi:hypothetical protein